MQDENKDPTPGGFAQSQRTEEKEDAAEQMGFKVNDRRFWTMDEDDLATESVRSEMPTFVEQLKNQVEEKDKQLRDYIAAYKKEVVENLETTKQRLERDAAMKIEQIRGQLSEPMMEVLDALERSLQMAETSSNFDGLHQGVKMVHLLMVQKLKEMGLERIPTVGEVFNPAIHEAISVTAVDQPEKDNRVMMEFKPGFLLGERVVRAAQVQVGKMQN